MNLTFLVILDKLSILFLFPIFLILKIKNFLIKSNNNKNLLIKIVGAGNLFSIKKILRQDKFELITLARNKSAVKKINNKINAYYIYDNNFLLMFFSILRIALLMLIKRYKDILILEANSNLSILFSLIPLSNRILGVSNQFKSIIDFFIYNFYLTNAVNVSRQRLLELLIKFKPKKNHFNTLAIKKIHEDFLINNIKKIKKIKNIIIAPGCANNDKLRRVKNFTWLEIIKFLINKKITVVFESENDAQYDFFKRQKDVYKNLNIKISNYSEFFFCIKKTDLLLTVDSQSLRIANSLNKLSISFYGATHPTGIELSKNTYPIYLGYECSPCNHKYYRYPCDGLAPCMNFNAEDLNIFKYIQ